MTGVNWKDECMYKDYGGGREAARRLAVRWTYQVNNALLPR